MRTIRVYQPGLYSIGDSIELSASASLHVAVVLRMKQGDAVILFCGDNREFSGRITTIHKRHVIVTIEQVQVVNRESPCRVHLAQAISKGDRMEWVIQKAVELGVHAITPILSRRAVVRVDAERLEKKCTQWQSIAIAACEQSGRNYIPMIRPVSLFDAYLKENQATSNYILCPMATQSWRDYDLTPQDMALLIGPEGGFCDDEIVAACAMGFQRIRLGPRILRTETAAISALTLLQARAGDL